MISLLSIGGCSDAKTAKDATNGSLGYQGGYFDRLWERITNGFEGPSDRQGCLSDSAGVRDASSVQKPVHNDSGHSGSSGAVLKDDGPRRRETLEFMTRALHKGTSWMLKACYISLSIALPVVYVGLYLVLHLGITVTSVVISESLDAVEYLLVDYDEC